MTRLKSSDHSILQQLKTVGIQPGVRILIEQRSPHYIVQLEGTSWVLSQECIEAIYVRLPGHCPISIPSQPKVTLTAWVKDLWNWFDRPCLP